MSITHQDDFDHVGQAETMLCACCEKFCNPKEIEEDEYGDDVCKSCRENIEEAAYETAQEKAFTDYWEGESGPDETYRRDMIEAGRGHLLR